MRVFRLHGLDWLCETRHWALLSLPIPLCTSCGGRVELALRWGDPSPHTRAFCLDADCPFDIGIPMHPNPLELAVDEEIYGILRAVYRRGAANPHGMQD